MTNEKIWAFDIGTGSLGEIVRFGIEIKHCASLLLPQDYASTQDAALRRRQLRTRLAHKAREAWLNQCFKEWGLPILSGRKVGLRKDGKWGLISEADPRLEREFPSKGDETCYNSLALRCRLLMGEKLEPWQLYKALRSAIQLRGYDKNIPWKTGEKRKDAEAEEQETAQKTEQFSHELKAMSGDKAYHYPAFFKAWKIGLWNPKKPTAILNRIDCSADRAAGYTISRDLVEAELLALMGQAAKHYPKLKGKGLYLLYGPSEKPYASYYPPERKKWNLKLGAENDWQGVLGQKIPRFDNRIIGKCCLMPRFNVCKIAPAKTKDDFANLKEEQRLTYEVTLLLKLHNMRMSGLDGAAMRLTAEQLKETFSIGVEQGYKFTDTAWKKLCAKFGAVPLPSQPCVEAPANSGRSSFCRPALTLIKELLFSGKTPAKFLEEKIAQISNKDPQKGLIKEDLRFLSDMGVDCAWENIHLPDIKTRTFMAMDPSRKIESIRALIGRQNDPVVRHRLFWFYERVRELEKKFGKPDKIVLEFIREDFMGEDALRELRIFQKKRRDERAEAAKKMDEAKTGGKQSLLRYQLLRQQNGICVYTGEPLELTQLESYEIDHIVPRSLGGPDAMLNYALTTRAHNADKGNRTPFDWLRGKGHWQAYLERVSKNSNFNRKKKDLLTSDKAVELAERYMSLAETAWIAKLAQTILAIHFQWPIGGIGGDRRIIVANGGLTAKIRNRYALGRLLQSPKDLAEKTDPSKLSQSEFVKYCEAIDKKNRNNKKHHALDAAILSFVPQWTRDRDKRDFFRFPKGVQENPQTYFKDILDKVVPEEIFHAKAKLEETFYAKRTIDGIAQMVLRRELRKLGYKTVQMKEVFSVESIAKNAKDILDRRTRELILDVAAREPSQEQWDQWCETARLPGGPRIRRVTLSIGEPTEYKDLSKDGSGIYAKGKNHRCQIVWRNKKGTYKVAPVYAHGPKKSLIESLKQLSEFQEIFGVFQSGQLVEIQSDIVANANTSLNKGIYTINSIWTDGRAKLTDIMGVQTPPVSLSKLISAGFRIYKG